MPKLPSSIFNDVIGPVMVGPSSSHTAGPARIGFLAGQLGDGRLSRINIAFETNGSFAMTYKGAEVRSRAGCWIDGDASTGSTLIRCSFAYQSRRNRCEF